VFCLPDVVLRSFCAMEGKAYGPSRVVVRLKWLRFLRFGAKNQSAKPTRAGFAFDTRFSDLGHIRSEINEIILPEH
jgi:hypothetical protein